MATELERRLDGVHLFSALPPEALRKLERQCRWRECAANDTILDRESEDRDVYFVVRGTVQVVNYSQSGRKIALASMAAGSYFGELAAIDSLPRSASVVAFSACLVATMAPRMFNQLVLDHPALGTLLLRRLARIIRACDDRIMDLSTLGAVQRVYIELLHLAESDSAGPDTWVISPMPAQKEIASVASTTRETVTRAISQLVAVGVAERKDNGLHINDRARLERLAVAIDDDWGEEGAR